MIITAVLFGLLWLSEDVPALLSDARPQSLIDMALPTNPVHILDLAFFLPAVIATGVMLIKQRPLAYTLAPTFIVFLILTGIPILLTPVVQTTAAARLRFGASSCPSAHSPSCCRRCWYGCSQRSAQKTGATR